MLSVACDVHPAFLERWVDIYYEKFETEGKAAAQKWYERAVPDTCKAKVLFLVRKRSMQ